MGNVFIIAEAGVNHNGKLGLAYEMVDAAAEAGADAVKFQTFNAETLVSKNAPKAEYQKRITGSAESQFDMLQRLELSEDMHIQLMDYCEKKGILFLSSPFDRASIDFLNQLGLDMFKVPSGEITNLPYLRKLGSLNKHVILSTGMAELVEVKSAIDILILSGTNKEKITALHCNTEYPSPYKDVNLKAMVTIRDELDVHVGYSDHTLGIEVPIAAVALGAVIIEKHFTLDRKMNGPDHEASIEPDELKKMVIAIRNIEDALGTGIKAPSQSEIKNIRIVRKSIFASRHIKKGELYSEENVTSKRPGNGISPMRWDEIIGKYASRDYDIDDLIEE